MSEYAQIDRSSLIEFLFYPRKDHTPCPKGAFDLLVPVDQDVSISCRFYAGDQNWPWILFFHGNGEVVSDYDGMAPFYSQKQINLVVADYRGYGASGGSPTFSDLVQDAHRLFRGVQEELSRKGFPGNLWIMGRSLGSISALELAFQYPDQIRGVIIESGFASVTRLIKHLGLPAQGIDLEPLEQERIKMIRKIAVPVLVIHGEYDDLVPLQEGQDLFEYLGSTKKQLIVIPQADHNNIMFVDLPQYLAAIQKFIQATK